MKKIFLLAAFFCSCPAVLLAQLMQASIGPGSASNRVKLYIRPNVTMPNAALSTLQFSLGISDAVTPKPVATVTASELPGVTWGITEANEAGYNHFMITTAASPIVISTTAGEEIEVMEIQFDGGPVTSNNVSLVTLPDGGVNTFPNGLFLCTGQIQSNGMGQLYYARAGVVVNNQNSYDLVGGTPGTAISTATLGGITLPVNWLSFDAVKHGNNGLLNWKVSNEESNHRYELQRSVNGTDFITIATVYKSGSGNGTRDYAYTDAGITSLGAGVLHYRIRQVDLDGRHSVSPTRILRMNVKGGISVFPNPVKEGFYVTIPFENAGSRPVKLNLTGTNGQLVQAREITALQATNYYFDISRLSLSPGQYQLQVWFEGAVLDTKKLFVERR